MKFIVKCQQRFTQLNIKSINYLKKKLKRGSVYLYINSLDPEKLKTEVETVDTLVESYIKALNKIKSKFNIEENVKISDIVRLPNIFSSSDINLTKEQEEKTLTKLEESCNKLISEREQEGRELTEDLNNKIKKINNEIETLEKEFEIHFEEKQKNINEKLHSICENTEESELRKNYLYSVLDKMDINEEIVRFNSHLKKLKDTINANSLEKGKSLDFTLQELGREINTILSKTPSAEISNVALNIKVEIEKSREQVQNVI